jgi:uncharacterized protein (DUF58 family)
MRPTPRCLAAFAAGLPAAALPALVAWEGAWVAWPGFLLAFGGAIAAELATLPRRVALRLRAPAAATPGVAATVTVEVVAPRRLLAHVDLDVAGDAELPAPAVLACAAGATAVAGFRLVPRRRGVLALAAVHVRWTGALGLLSRELVYRQPAEVRVLADVAAVRRRTARMITNREFTTGLKPERYVGDGSDFESLRDFVAGMDRRAIDWKATARHREVLCREFRAERDHPVMLCIDSGRLMGELLDGMPRLDHAILAALQLAYVCLRTGDRVGLFTFADKPQATVLPQAGVHALQAIQERLTSIAYSPAETNFTLGMTELLRQLRRRTLVVLFTDFADSVTAELMLRNVAWLARRHLLLFVALRDPLPERLADAELGAPRDLHRAVVADEIRRERLLVLERIRQTGAQVLDAAAADLDGGLIDRYLQVKRRELL